MKDYIDHCVSFEATDNYHKSITTSVTVNSIQKKQYYNQSSSNKPTFIIKIVMPVVNLIIVVVVRHMAMHVIHVVVIITMKMYVERNSIIRNNFLLRRINNYKTNINQRFNQ